MNLDINYLTRTFFYFDKPVNYLLDKNNYIKIFPVMLEDSEIFLSSMDILTIDKNSIPDTKIIQMSYLQFLFEKQLQDRINQQKLLNILILCLKMKRPSIKLDRNNRPIIIDLNENNIVNINSKQFDEIKRIILYQNLIDYDDEYINPELKKNIEESNYLKNRNIEVPTLERKIAIITAHTGISKQEQLKMTYRSHSLLFDEVYEETEYTTLYPLAVFGGETDKIEKWIYKQKKGKFDGKVVSVSSYNKQAGGDGNVGQRIINQNKED